MAAVRKLSGKGIEESRGSSGKRAGESQGGATCRIGQQKTDRRAVPAQVGDGVVRVKRCGKSAPACGATFTARQPPLGARPSVRVRPWQVSTCALQVGCIDGWSPIRIGKPIGAQNSAYRPTHLLNVACQFAPRQSRCHPPAIDSECQDAKRPHARAHDGRFRRLTPIVEI